MRIHSQERAENGQVRVWVEVENGDLLMLKLDAKADPFVVAAEVLERQRGEKRGLEIGRDAEPDRQVDVLEAIEPSKTLAVLFDSADIAEIDEEIARLQARRAELVAARGR